MRIGAALVFVGLLGGCASHWMKTAQSECAAQGFAAGTPEYTWCVEGAFNAKRASFRRSMAIVGAGMGGAAQNLRQQRLDAQSNYHPMGARVFRYSYISGTNRICVYARLGSQEVETIDAAAICPLT